MRLVLCSKFSSQRTDTSQAWVSEPANVIGLTQYMNNLPKLAATNPNTSIDIIQQACPRRDPFECLPVEILSEILLLLPRINFIHFRIASSSAAEISLSNGFWKRRINQDMPFLFEISSFLGTNTGGSVDWRQVYSDMDIRSRVKNVSSKGFLGLINRRRIWKICQQIAVVYLRLERMNAGARKEDEDVSEIRRDSSCDGAPLVGQPAEGQSVASFPPQPLKVFFASLRSDLRASKAELQLFWFNKCLSGIAYKSESRACLFGQTYGRADTFQIKRGDSIAGFELNIGRPQDEYREIHTAAITGVTVSISQ